MVTAERAPPAVVLPSPRSALGGPTVKPGPTAPALPTGHVQRRRLLALLDAGVQQALTLVSASAGTGKTVLVSSWLAAGPSLAPVGWVWDDPRAVPGTMWHDLVEVLGNAGVAVPVLAAGAPRDRLDRAVLAGLGSACGESPRPLVVVLESEAFAAPDMGADLDFLLRHSGGQLRVVLVTRADPVAPLHRYRLAETMREIRTADLAFTVSEARELLTRAGVELPPEAVEQLMLRTKGWAAGLRFAALFLSQREDPERAVVDFTGDSGTVAEYLLAEVLNAQSADIRRLLLRTSVVDVLRPGLVDTLAGTPGRRALSLLMRFNAFVQEVPGRAGEYAYHPIFRELLRAELGYESPSIVNPLHLVAADWLFAHDLVAEAVQHAVAAGAWDRAAAYVVDSLTVAEMSLDARGSRVAELLADLPSEVPGAPAALVRAAFALACSDRAECDQKLGAARVALDRSGTRSWAAELTLLVIRLAHTSAVMDVDAGLAAASAVELSMNQHARGVERHPQLVSLVHRAHGDLLLAAGEVDAAVEAFTAGTVLTNGPGSELQVADCLGALALVAARLGHARQAVTMAERALRFVDMTGNPTQHGSHAAQVALAWVELERYNVDAARRHARQAERCRQSSPTSQAMLTVVKARLASARGDLDGAMATIRQGQRETDRSLLWPAGLLALELSSLELLAGHPDQAAQTVAQLPSDTERALRLAQARQDMGDEPDMAAMAVRAASSPLPVRVRGWLLEASRSLAAGREPEALRALERSLRLAEPERLRRPFREAPNPIRRLLRQHSEVSQRHGWLGADRAPAAEDTAPLMVSSGQEVALALVVEPLTERELEVLGHLAQLLTTQEIAGEMFLSVNTIRTHVRNILRKLSASRRNEAVRRARELRII